MNIENFKFSFQNNPVYLCQNKKHFYEIKLDCNTGTTIIRKGILLQNSTNPELPCKVSEAIHEFASDAINFIEEKVTAKIKEGFVVSEKILNKLNDLAQFDRENQSSIKRSIVKDKGTLFSNQKQYNSDIKNRSNQQAIQEEADSRPLAEIRKEINFNDVEVRKPRCVVDPDLEKGFPQDPKIISKKIIKLLIGSQKPIARTGRLLQKQLFTPIIKKQPQNPVKDYNIFIRPFTLTEQDDPTGLYMTGKFIGIDCYWNGSNLVSSCGTKYTPPSKFLSEFPPGYPLIGTLYLPNANSTHYQAILAHTGNKSSEWLQLKFKVYDLIRHDMPFKMRLQKLKEMFKETSFIEICNYRECKSKKDLQDELQKVKSIGGKGIYLKHLNMPFKGGKAGGFYEFK